MESTNFTESGGGDVRISTPDGDFLLEVKRTSNAAELRGALLSLAYALQAEPTPTRAICVLVDTRFSGQRVRDEIGLFRGVVGAKLGGRIFLVVVAGRTLA